MLYEPSRQWMKDYLRVRMMSGATAGAGWGLVLTAACNFHAKSDIIADMGITGVVFGLLGVAGVLLFDLVFRTHSFSAIATPEGIHAKSQGPTSMIRWEDILYLYFHGRLKYLTIHAEDGRLLRVAMSPKTFFSIAHEMAAGRARLGLDLPFRCTVGSLILWLATSLILIPWPVVGLFVGIQNPEMALTFVTGAGALTAVTGSLGRIRKYVYWIAREDDGWRLILGGRSLRLYETTSPKVDLSRWRTNWMGQLDLVMSNGKCLFETLVIAPWLAGPFISIAIEAERFAQGEAGLRLPETLEFSIPKFDETIGVATIAAVGGALIVLALFWAGGLWFGLFSLVCYSFVVVKSLETQREGPEQDESAYSAFSISPTLGIQYPTLAGAWLPHNSIRDIGNDPKGGGIDLIGASGEKLFSLSGSHESLAGVLEEVLDRIPLETVVPMEAPTRNFESLTVVFSVYFVSVALLAILGREYLSIYAIIGIPVAIALGFFTYRFLSAKKVDMQFVRINGDWVEFVYRDEITRQPLSDFSEVRYGLVPGNPGQHELLLRLVTLEGREIPLRPAKQKSYGLFLWLRRELAGCHAGLQTPAL